MAKTIGTKQSNSLLWTSIAFTVLLVLISASFQSYFFLSPSTTYPALGFFQTLYTTCWFILVGVPPIVLIVVPNKTTAVRIWLIVAAALFPIAVIGDHAALAATYGNPYIDYLASFPILFVSHLLIPAAYIVLFSLGFRKNKPEVSQALPPVAPAAPEAAPVWPPVVQPAPHDNNWQPTEIHHY